MRIAYLIMVHKNERQFERLLRALQHDRHHYLVHVDAKCSESFHHSVQEICSRYDSVHVLPSIDVSWGGWSVVQVHLNAIRYLVEFGLEWDYFVNLSGQCFPLKSQDYIIEYLYKHPGNYMYFFDLQKPKFKADILYRQTSVFEERNGESFRTNARRATLYQSHGIQAYLGSQWVVLTRAFSEFLIRDEKVVIIADYLKSSHIPDEMFFQTALMASPYRDTIYNYSRILIMDKPVNEKAHPIILTNQHFGLLVLNDELFARKFDEQVDPTVLDLLEFHIRNQ